MSWFIAVAAGIAYSLGLKTLSALSLPADFDRDGDVDQSDFGIFQRCFSGEGNPANSDCAK